MFVCVYIVAYVAQVSVMARFVAVVMYEEVTPAAK